MQLKLKRSQRTAGLMGGKVLFALDARAELSAEERSLVQKYGIGKIVVYESVFRHVCLLRAAGTPTNSVLPDAGEAQSHGGAEAK